VVSPGNKLAASGTAANSKANSKQNPSSHGVGGAGHTRTQSTTPQLVTTFDDVWDSSELNPCDAEATKRRNAARREEVAADLSLLPGHPWMRMNDIHGLLKCAKRLPIHFGMRLHPPLMQLQEPLLQACLFSPFDCFDCILPCSR
jgi:hypothetical protein